MIRSMLYVPAHSERFVSKAHLRGADAIILDLEDSVAPQDKDVARDGLIRSVATVGQSGAEVFVRVNSGDDLQLADAVAACRAGAVGLVIPKVQTHGALETLATAMGPIEAEIGRPALQFIALIEDPGAVMNAASIARASRLLGMATGGEDLALALGAVPTPAVLTLPKLLVHYAAKAKGLLSLGLLRSVADYSDLDAVNLAALEAREHGFDGATCVHPNIVPLLNAGFSPIPTQIEWARRVIAMAEHQTGAFAMDGQMIDAPVVARARRIIADARQN